jgi:DNA-directed RNA polymerase specialized sigma24 family protein
MSVEKTLKVPKEVNWGLVFKKLLARGLFVTSRAPDIFDGVSVEDVVSDAFLQFFLDKDRLGWKPELGSLEAFLWSMVRRKITDHLRRGARASSVEDENVRVVAERNGQFVTDPRPSIESRDHVEHLKSFVSGDPELERLIRAGEATDGKNINQAIAENLSISPHKVVNLKKRLHRRINAGMQKAGTYARKD